jgi:hypothetical protein
VPRLVDLSQEIYQGMGVYPGHLKTVVWDHATHAETIRLFEGGFSTKAGHAGVGLALVRDAVAAAGGTLEIRASTLTVAIPVP